MAKIAKTIKNNDKIRKIRIFSKKARATREFKWLIIITHFFNLEVFRVITFFSLKQTQIATYIVIYALYKVLEGRKTGG